MKMTVTRTELSLYWLLLTVLLLLIPLRVVDFVSYSGQQRAAILRDLARPQLYSAVRDALDSGAEKCSRAGLGCIMNFHGTRYNHMDL